jgi:hypothetical protein
MGSNVAGKNHGMESRAAFGSWGGAHACVWQGAFLGSGYRLRLARRLTVLCTRIAARRKEK